MFTKMMGRLIQRLVSLTESCSDASTLVWFDFPTDNQTVIVLTAAATEIAITITARFAEPESGRPIANMPVEQPQMIAVAATRPFLGLVDVGEKEGGMKQCSHNAAIAVQNPAVKIYREAKGAIA